jgi:glycine/D-amino acid oxidase-like deaminating enzyme
MAKEHFVILGSGVVGLTNAIHLQDNFPSASITIIAKHLPGDFSIEYTSPWAGAAWLPIARDDRTRSYERFGHSKLVSIARNFPESGVVEMPVRFFMDAAGHEDLEHEKNIRMNAWFKDIVGGIREVAAEELPAGAAFGFEFDSLLMNPAVYLPWSVCLSLFFYHFSLTW